MGDDEDLLGVELDDLVIDRLHWVGIADLSVGVQPGVPQFLKRASRAPGTRWFGDGRIDSRRQPDGL